MAYGFNDNKSKAVFNDFIVVGEQLVSEDVQIRSSMITRNVGYSFDITKTGYIPIGITGVEFEKAGLISGDTIDLYLQFNGWHFYSQSGKDYLYIGVRRLPNRTDDVTYIVKTRVLYMKIGE